MNAEKDDYLLSSSLRRIKGAASQLFGQRSASREPEAQIILHPELQARPQEVQSAWIVYASTAWHSIKERSSFAAPNEDPSRSPFELELESRRALAEAWLGLRSQEPTLADKYLDDLVRVQEAGYLAEYAWHFFLEKDWETPERTLRMDHFLEWLNEQLPGHQVETWAILRPTGTVYAPLEAHQVSSADSDLPSLRYVFANLYLRGALFEIGVGDVLFTNRGTEYLRGMWERCSRDYPQGNRLGPSELRLLEVVRYQDWVILPVVFPEPDQATEPFFGAIALRQGQKRWGLWRAKPQLRYFLLELKEPASAHGTTLGEWTMEQHLNYGNGPPPEVEPFIERVADVLDGRVNVVARYVRPPEVRS